MARQGTSRVCVDTRHGLEALQYVPPQISHRCFRRRAMPAVRDDELEVQAKQAAKATPRGALEFGLVPPVMYVSVQAEGRQGPQRSDGAAFGGRVPEAVDAERLQVG